MGLKFAELFIWFKTLSLPKMILYGAAILLTAVGLLGYMIFYAMWRNRYYWMYEEYGEKFTETCDKAKKISDDTACGLYDSLKALVPVGLALSIVAIAIFVATSMVWLFLSNSLFWNICLGAAGLISLVAGIIGFVLCAKVSEKFEITEIKKCTFIQGHDIAARTLDGKEISSNEYNTSQKYCEKSTGPNGAFSAIIVVGIILDAVAFFLLK